MPAPDASPDFVRLLKIAGLNARVGSTVAFALIGAELVALSVPGAWKPMAYAITGAATAMFYWRVWGWALGLAKR